jgi:hypothetical protein
MQQRPGWGPQAEAQLKTRPPNPDPQVMVLLKVCITQYRTGDLEFGENPNVLPWIPQSYLCSNSVGAGHRGGLGQLSFMGLGG